MRIMERCQVCTTCQGAFASCSELKRAQLVTPATLSDHIKEMQNAGLLTIARQGKFMTLRLNRPVLAAYLAQFAKI